MTTSISEMTRQDEEKQQLFKKAVAAADVRFDRDNRRGDYMEGFIAGWRACEAERVATLR